MGRAASVWRRFVGWKFSPEPVVGGGGAKDKARIVAEIVTSGESVRWLDVMGCRRSNWHPGRDPVRQHLHQSSVVNGIEQGADGGLTALHANRLQL
jgi:hypothetical protein